MGVEIAQGGWHGSVVSLFLQNDLYVKENLSTNLVRPWSFVELGQVIFDVLFYKGHGPSFLGTKDSTPQSICRE